MSKPFILYGWHLSFYAGKVRCYLRYKHIPFIDQDVSLYTLAVPIKRHTGAAVMPVVRTPEGQWLQDSSVIIDQLEARFPARPVIPQSPVQRFASTLLEVWGDEWWIPIAMHTRWSYPENFALFERDAGRALLPGFPRFLQNMAVGFVASKLRGYVPRVGIRPEQFAMMESWTRIMLDHLDAHFARHRFLFGDRPTLGDFGVVGTMYGHLGRDPWPKRELVDPRKNLRAWIDRMAAPPDGEAAASLVADDEIPATLTPVFNSVSREFLPMIEAVVLELQRLAPTVPQGTPLPRGGNDITFPMGNGRFSRAALIFAAWKVQRLLDVFKAMSAGDQAKVRAWAATAGVERVLDLQIPRLRHVGLQVALEKPIAVIGS